MKAEWYFGTGKYDGCEKVKTLAQFEGDHPLATKTHQGKFDDKLAAIYECSNGNVARIYK